MHNQVSFECRCCGERHDGLPFSYGSNAPAYWRHELGSQEASLLSEEQCVIAGEHFFVRARIILPVSDAETDFDWGVWVSLSERNYHRMGELWTTSGREQEAPYFGYLATEIPLYQPSTLTLKTNLHTQPVGQRPLVELEPTDHPLAIEQRTGITLARVQQIAEAMLHPPT
jgi:hypothetical protein